MDVQAQRARTITKTSTGDGRTAQGRASGGTPRRDAAHRAPRSRRGQAVLAASRQRHRWPLPPAELGLDPSFPHGGRREPSPHGRCPSRSRRRAPTERSVDAGRRRGAEMQRRRRTRTRTRKRTRQRRGEGADGRRRRKRPPARGGAPELPGHVLPRHGGAGRAASRAGVRDRAQHRGAGAGPVADPARASPRARPGSSTSVEKAVGKPLPELKSYRALADRDPAEVVDPGAQPLRQDRRRSWRRSSRSWTSTACSSTRRWPRSSGWAARSQGLALRRRRFRSRPRPRRSRDYVHAVAVQGAPAQGGQERVREGEPAPGGVDRPPVQPRPPAAAGPDPGGQHRPDEGGRALRLPPRLPLLDLRQLVDPPRHQPGAGRQGSRGAPAGAHDRRLPPDRQGAARAAVQARAAGRPPRRSPRRPASRPTSSRR